MFIPVPGMVGTIHTVKIFIFHVEKSRVCLFVFLSGGFWQIRDGVIGLCQMMCIHVGHGVTQAVSTSQMRR